MTCEIVTTLAEQREISISNIDDWRVVFLMARITREQAKKQLGANSVRIIGGVRLANGDIASQWEAVRE